MPQIVTLTKKILDKNINSIMKDTADFKYNNWDKENYYTDLPDKWKLSIALLTNGDISGFSVNSKKTDTFYIHFLYIFKNFRGTKAGVTLLTECEKLAAENNFNKLQLKCSKNNESALKFYLKYGYNTSNTNEENYYLLEKKLY